MAKRLRQESTSEDERYALSDSRSISVETIDHPTKYASLEPESSDKSSSTAMRCLLPPHKPLSFSTYNEYESHYQQAHTNRCDDCKSNFPSSFYLELHIMENHDPLVATRRDRGEKTYKCFAEDCGKVCLDWKKRRSHLVDKHAFPRNYDFFIINTGIDRRRSMLRPGVDAQGHRKSSRDRRGSSATEHTESTEATSVSEPDKRDGNEPVRHLETEKMATAGVEELTNSMSSLKMVPRSVTFGKRGRAGLAKS